jgi:GPH family glycoside/pentoside/hexuronide:cation symporter
MAEPRSNPQDASCRDAEAAAARAEPAPPEWKRPSLGIKLCYALPSFATAAMLAPLTIELKIFYTDTVFVPAGLLAVAMAVARTLDAVTDPVMGWITDHTRSRFGRRKPWLPLGVPLSALCYWLMFAPPGELSPGGGAVVWLCATYCLFYLFHTVWAVPYHGLGFELSPDYDDRTNLFGYRSIVGGTGVICCFGSLYYFKARHLFSDERQMLALLTGSLALLMVALFAAPLLGVKEHPGFAGRKRAPLVPGVRRALRNRPFRILLLATVLGSIPSTMPMLLMPYFAKYVLGVEDRWRIIFAVIYVGSGFLSLPVWMLLARRLGKLPGWMLAAGIGIVSSFIMFTVGPGQTGKMMLLESVRGFAAAAVVILGPAMLADVIDYDELGTGRRREAQFGAFLSLIPKLVAILGATLPLAVMGAAGYDPTGEKLSEATLLSIRILFALFPIAFHAGALAVLLRYPISRDVHRAIRESIGRQRRGEPAADPVTGRTRLPREAQRVDEQTGWLLDNFSPAELRRMARDGTRGLVGRVLGPVLISALLCAAASGCSVWLLFGSLSRSRQDQLNQGAAACLIVAAGLALTLLLYHLLRLRPAAGMARRPVDPEIIRAHLQEMGQ